MNPTASPTDKQPHDLISSLITDGHLSKADAQRVSILQSQSQNSYTRLLSESGLVPVGVIAETWSKLTGYPIVSNDELSTAEIPEGLSQKFLKQYNMLPFAAKEHDINVAVVDPSDDYALQAMQLATDKTLNLRIGTPDVIESAINRIFETNVEPEDAPFILETSGDETDDVEKLKDLASEAPVVRMVNTLINKAVELQASDIHIEPYANSLSIRYRIDGILQEVDSQSSQSTAAVISRVKIMAKLNIAERRRPQDGRIQLRIHGREIDLRVSTVPTLHGESVVLRILDKGKGTLDLIKLGFDQSHYDEFVRTIKLPHGIMVVTGPTGSGKTTTLYAALEILNTPDKKIITVEDPVEYQLDGITQIQVKTQIDLTFANALRSVVRQDPDIIMIGEMRDLETASIAVQAALTGHMVFSTLHTNDAGSAITRLLDMGMQDYLLTSTVNAIVAQRLVRTLCRHCRKPTQLMPELIKELELDKLAGSEALNIHEPVGCEHCAQTGFSGRTIILEFLPINDTIRQAVLAKSDGNAIQKLAVSEGMQNMRTHGLRKVIRGETTLEEIFRVTQEL